MRITAIHLDRRIGSDGTVAVPARAGIGAVLDPGAVDRWRVSRA